MADELLLKIRFFFNKNNEPLIIFVYFCKIFRNEKTCREKEKTNAKGTPCHFFCFSRPPQRQNILQLINNSNNEKKQPYFHFFVRILVPC